jgi:putative peptidoglycan lipid II flippase
MNLLRATATVSALTLLSRITGLIRENLTASLFGASVLTDAFFVAFRLPNLLRRLFAEGAFSQAFVPILAEMKGRHPQQLPQMVNQVATALFWTVLAVCLIGALAAPLLVWTMASGLAQQPSAFSAAVQMTRWMFPYILCMSLVALSAGILNTWQRFAVPAFTPVLLNLAFIGCALIVAPHLETPIYALAVGVIVGGALQLAIQIPALSRIGLLPRIGLGIGQAFGDAHTRRILARMAPAVLAVSVAQLSLIINTHIASRLATGSVSWVSYADRLMEFPTALLGVALGTVLLANLARASAQGDVAGFSQMLDWGLRVCVLLALPAMAGLAWMAEPLTAVLFHYGQFGAHDVQMTRLAVLGYSVGLLGLIAVKVLAPGFYASQDVRTPVRIGVASLAVTQLLNLALVPPFAHAGLTLSISLAALFNAALLLAGLRRRGLYEPRPGWGRFAGQVTAGLSVMSAWLYWAVPKLDWIGLRAQPGLRILLVSGIIAAACVGYLGTLAACGVKLREFTRRAPG